MGIVRDLLLFIIFILVGTLLTLIIDPDCHGGEMKKIKGFDYFISKEGKVFDLKGAEVLHTYCYYNQSRVYLKKDGKKYKRYVSSLIVETYKNHKLASGERVHFIDGNNRNFAPENLRVARVNKGSLHKRNRDERKVYGWNGNTEIYCA